MVRKYKYITFSDRKQIAALYQSNARPADIAEKIGVTAAAIYGNNGIVFRKNRLRIGG